MVTQADPDRLGLLQGNAILACVGIYGVVAYSVAQRSIEIGIRMALGASRNQIVILFLSRSLTAAIIGILAGAIAAIFLTRLLRPNYTVYSPVTPLP